MREFLVSPPLWSQLAVATLLALLASYAYANVPMDSLMAGNFSWHDVALLLISAVSALSSVIVLLVGVLCRIGYMLLRDRFDQADDQISKVRHRVKNLEDHGADMASKWAHLDADVENLQLIVFRSQERVRTQ